MRRVVQVPERVVVVFVSDELAAELRVWSDPVQIMVVPRDGDELVCDVVVRRVES